MTLEGGVLWTRVRLERQASCTKGSRYWCSASMQSFRVIAWVHLVHAMNAEQCQMAVNLWTKQMDFSRRPACRQLWNYTHHHHLWLYCPKADTNSTIPLLFYVLCFIVTYYSDSICQLGPRNHYPSGAEYITAVMKCILCCCLAT